MVRTKVIERLKITDVEYEIELFNIWLSWCEGKTRDFKSMQRLVIYQPLFNWWLNELEKLERAFLKETQPYDNLLSSEIALGYWRMSTNKIHSHFSKTLIRKANEL